MSQFDHNGVRPGAAAPVLLPDGSYRLVGEDGPADTTPRPDTRLAFPPRSDVVPETPGEELNDLVNAMSAYKRARRLPTLSWHDVLAVLHDLGYRKTDETAVSSPPPGRL